MNQATQAPLATVRACTPARMARANVPFDAALVFHTRIVRRGPRSRDELNLFNCVRALVARSP